MQILIRNGQVVDPAAGTVQKADVLVENGKIERIAPEIREEAARVLEAEGCYVMPGSVSYTHLDVYKRQLVYRLDKLQKSTGLDLRVFEDAITFKIALMVVKYMKYMESLEY